MLIGGRDEVFYPHDLLLHCGIEGNVSKFRKKALLQSSRLLVKRFNLAGGGIVLGAFKCGQTIKDLI
jgi:hypothetical protein